MWTVSRCLCIQTLSQFPHEYVWKEQDRVLCYFTIIMFCSFTEERRHNYVSICLPRKVLLHFWDFVQQTSDLKCFFTIFNNAQFCMSKQSTSGSSTQHEGSTIRWGLQLALTETCVLVHLRWTSILECFIYLIWIQISFPRYL